MKAAGIESTPGDGGQKGVKPVGKVSLKVVYEIAKVKHQDAHLQGKPLYAIASNIVASAKNLGIEIVY
jgi:large subunit ribosomal protein L11